MQKFEDIAEMHECSFIPRVNRSMSPPRDVDTYIRDQETHLLSKQRKVKEQIN